MYRSERNRISNIERPTLNVEVTRLRAEDGITTDQHDHWQWTTGPLEIVRRKAGGVRGQGDKGPRTTGSLTTDHGPQDHNTIDN